jgi:hypothetical protein
LVANAELSQETHTVEVRHVNVGDDQIGGAAADAIERRLAVCSGLDSVPFLREDFPKKSDSFFVVIDD